MSQEMVRLKYIGPKAGGLPVTYPIGCKQKSGIKKTVWAEPYLDCLPDEAAFLLKDQQNWAKADEDDFDGPLENRVVEVVKPKAVRASVVKAAQKAESQAKAEKRGRGRPKMPPPEVKPAEAPKAEEPAAKPKKKAK